MESPTKVTPYEFKIGDMVEVASKIGEVRYVGPLPDKDGVWLGKDTVSNT